FVLFTCLSLVGAGESKGTFDLLNADINKQVLKLYKDCSGMELVVSSQVERLTTVINLKSLELTSKSELMRLIEKALVDQAGVVITRLDDKRASVTWND